MSIKLSLAIACVIALLWVEFADRYLGNQTKIILIIISGVLALISYIKNLHEPLVIFVMIMIGIMYSGLYLYLHFSFHDIKKIRIQDIDKNVWMGLVFTLNML